MNEVFFTYYVDVWIECKICGLMMVLLRMCKVMEFHMYNKLVDYDWGNWQGLELFMWCAVNICANGYNLL